MGNKTATEVAQAFHNGRKLSKGSYSTDGDNFYFFGNRVAWREGYLIYVQDCGWCTATTAIALNAIPYSPTFRRQKDEWIVNERIKWNGKKIEMNELNNT
jgi:hypothetical protein